MHAVVKGATSALDIVSVVQPPGRRYFSFLSINFGLITNLDIGTEHLRWEGGWADRQGMLHAQVLVHACVCG